MPIQPVISLVAPSAFLPDAAALDRAVERISGLGWRLKYDAAALLGRAQRFSATDAERIAALYAAAEDPDSNVVMALRGGYGLSRLLDVLDLDRLAAGGKLWIGHSDFTVLQLALLARCGRSSLAGPMAATDFGAEQCSEYMLAHLRCWFERGRDEIEVACDPQWQGSLEGMLWGGNLTMLAHLAGSPYLPRIEAGILFVEDAGESPFRIERLLYQLWHAGILQSQRALVMGQFSDYRLTDRDNGYDLPDVIAHWRDKLGIPILGGLPFGHVADKLSLPVGGWARVSASGSAYTLRSAFNAADLT